MPRRPTYADMIARAIQGLGEKHGSSRQSIHKYIQANYLSTDTAQINRALKKGVAEGRFVQPKGPSGPVKFGRAWLTVVNGKNRMEFQKPKRVVSEEE
jgi:histone H1/5